MEHNVIGQERLAEFKMCQDKDREQNEYYDWTKHISLVWNISELQNITDYRIGQV